MDALKGINGVDKPESDSGLTTGYRFQPSSEELCDLLKRKVLNSEYTFPAIGELDLQNREPSQILQGIGKGEGYFYTRRHKKYRSGNRVDRATRKGFWKATGKEVPVFSSQTSSVVGKKKTLVFYRGRAPHGEKTDFVIHEYRLQGMPGTASKSIETTKEWVICKIFRKEIKAKNHTSVQTDKVGSSSLMTTNGSPLAGRHITDDGGRCNNNQVSCIAKQQQYEHFEGSIFFRGQIYVCKGEHPLIRDFEALLQENFGEKIIQGNGNTFTTGDFTCSGEEFMTTFCSSPPNSGHMRAASKQTVEKDMLEHAFEYFDLEPDYNPGDLPYLSLTIDGSIHSWPEETIAGSSAFTDLQLPGLVESGKETDPSVLMKPLGM